MAFVFILFSVALFIFILWAIDQNVKSNQKLLDDKELEEAKIREAEIEYLQREFDTKQIEYKSKLAELKSNPINSDIRESALQLGRELSLIGRNIQGLNGVTIFDEVAVMNDINAACANMSPNGKETNAQSVEERLAKLSELKEKSLISEQEYDIKRRKILDEI